MLSTAHSTQPLRRRFGRTAPRSGPVTAPQEGRSPGWKAPEFALTASDGRQLSLSELAGKRGTLVMFLSNACPYVMAALDRILRDARALAPLGIGIAAICPNDPRQSPADGIEGMARLARDRGFPFPYLADPEQQVARAFGAACTPEFFGLDGYLRLQYRGRIDSSGRVPSAPGARRELYEAMALISATGSGPADQHPSHGCAIKWARG